MKYRDKVRCIDNKRLDSEATIDYLTEGKIYTVLSAPNEFIKIENDIDKIHAYFATRFEVVEEARDFVKGDIVRCIDNSNHSLDDNHKLTVGREYTVYQVEEGFINVMNDADVISSYFKERFELVTKEDEEVVNVRNEFAEGDIVKCLDDTNAKSEVCNHRLTIGKLYKVVNVDDTYIDITNDIGVLCSYYKERFELVYKNEEVFSMGNEFKEYGKAICTLSGGLDDEISLYKVYDILAVHDNSIVIENDKGLPNPYVKSRFKPFNEIKPSVPNTVLETDNLKVDENGTTTITAKSLTITDKEGNVVSGIDETGEPYKIYDGEKKPMLSISNADMASSTYVANAINANELIIQLPKVVNVLGTEYTIEVVPVEVDDYLEGIHGYCDFLTKSIVLRKVNPLDYLGNIDAVNAQYKVNLRHEIMHAFLYESGLDGASVDGWARNEEMVDYMALQFPKILKACTECGIVE